MKTDLLYLAGKALSELADCLESGYYDLEDIITPNYSDICDRLDWPDLQDGGIYEQAIYMAAEIIRDYYAK